VHFSVHWYTVENEAGVGQTKHIGLIVTDVVSSGAAESRGVHGYAK